MKDVIDGCVVGFRGKRYGAFKRWGDGLMDLFKMKISMIYIQYVYHSVRLPMAS